MLPNIEAAIFDFDGTLVDASAAICFSFNHVLEIHGRPRLDDDAIHAMIGRPLREMFARVFPDATPDDIALHVREYRDAFHPVSRRMSKPLPGLHEVLPLLADRMKLAIATSRTVQGAVHILEEMKLERYFGVIIGIDEVTAVKPHPEAVRRALDRLGVAPARAVMIGDTTDDVLAGRAAGVATIGISADLVRRGHLAVAGADYIVETLSDLLSILGLE
ncbi:MAG: HAD-IA family hydrolase [Kiritimatiellae bacterium]|nr:HAD-IA family hydrolase [Kiritimatiellia bacterium]